MAPRALTVLRIGSLVARAVPLGALIGMAELVGARLGPRLMVGKAEQMRRHIERVWATGDPPTAVPATTTSTGAGIGTGGTTAATMAETTAAVRRGFGSYGRYWVESFRIPHLTDATIDRGFSFIGYEKILAARTEGVGPILVLPHLGGWEWAAAWLGRIAEVEVTAVVERLEPEEVFDWFTRLRQAYGVNVVPLGPRAMVELMAAVKRSDVVCLLSDRDIGGNGVEVDFFGERTTLPAGPALLARRTGAPLLPTTVYFRGRQRICLVGDPIRPESFAGEPDGRQRNRLMMQEVADRLEEMIRQAPDQWHLLEPNWPSDRSLAAGPTDQASVT